MSMPCRCHQQRALCGPAKFGRSPASRRVLALPRSRPGSLWRARAGAEGGETSAGPSLTLEEAYSVLGVKEGASFDECLNAKNALQSRFDGDKQKCVQLEQAYDRILQQQLAARLRGELPVSSKVRFADVPQRRPAPRPQRSKGGAATLPGGIRVGPPRGNDLVIQAGVFGGLTAWVLIQDLFTPAGVGAGDVPTLQLALGAAAAVYFMREQKRSGLGKALGLSLGGLVLGALLGSGLESWLRVDIVPLGGIDSPGTIVGGFALAGLAAVSILLS